MAAIPAHPPAATWQPLVARALAEDVGTGDVTSEAIFSADTRLVALIEAREMLVVCGLRVAAHAFLELDPDVQVEPACGEGETAEAGQALLHVRGPARTVLAAERVALNLLARTCGVATHTQRFVEKVAGTRTSIVDTRKTLPGWRALDKYAVAVGGGTNHRTGLFDAILVKDNHAAAAGSVEAAVKAARASAPPHLWLQAEVESEADAEAALRAGADSLLLDNRSPAEVRRLVARFGAETVLEASGGIHLDNVREYAETGVHRISLGALTQRAPSSDVALEIVRPEAA